jgi:ABC-type antimicrobial peptide transport system permease subunit
MFGVFGALALVVAALGLYSVIAYSVAQRTGELGIRIALGARATDIVTLVGSQGARLAGTGIVIAVAGAAALAPFVQPLLFQVSARSAGTYAAAAVVMVVVGIAASLVPAARAARVSPMSVMRSE